MPPKLYFVTIPQGVAEGQPFNVIVGGNMVTVVRPYGTVSGSRMEVSVDQKPSMNKSTSSQSARRSPINQPHSQSHWHWQLFSAATLWLGFEIAAFVLLVLCLVHNPFATLQVSPSCQLLNPKTGIALKEGYFNLWRGFGDTPECSNADNHFCVRWSNYGAWNRFQGISNGDGVYASINIATDYQNSCYYTWTTTQALVVTATVFAFMAVAGQIAAIKSPPVTVCVGFLLIVVFALSLAAITQTAYGSSTLQISSWIDFLDNGGSVSLLLNQKQPLLSHTDPAVSASCHMKLSYADGGAFLAAAVVISFIIMSLIFISACCGWLVTPYTLTDRSNGGRRPQNSLITSSSNSSLRGRRSEPTTTEKSAYPYADPPCRTSVV